MFYEDDLHIYRAAPLNRFEWLEHGFGTRSATPRVADGQLATLRQIHSDICLHTDGLAGCIGQGDALVTASEGVFVSVRTADCFPILLVDESLRAVAAVHAGWRGTSKQIVAKAVGEMTRLFGSKPSDIHAAIGPGIGVCCYEVGREVADGFRELFPERPQSEGPAHLDLAEANRRQLMRTGLSPDRVYVGAPCTCCHAENFHSFRRDHDRTGRMISLVGIKP